MSDYICTFNIGQGNKEVCFHFNSQSCSQAVIIFDAYYLKYKQKFYQGKRKITVSHIIL